MTNTNMSAETQKPATAPTTPSNPQQQNQSNPQKQSDKPSEQQK